MRRITADSIRGGGTDRGGFRFVSRGGCCSLAYHESDDESRLTPGTGALPRTVEVQLQHGNAGDVIGLQGFPIASGGQARWFERDSPVAGRISGVKKAMAAEKPPGEWNRVELEARDGRYTVRVNGELVNEVSGVEVKAGPIGLQSEGGEIHFRGVMLTAW